jgi:hypothetical protein
MFFRMGGSIATGLRVVKDISQQEMHLRGDCWYGILEWYQWSRIDVLQGSAFMKRGFGVFFRACLPAIPGGAAVNALSPVAIRVTLPAVNLNEENPMK